MIWAEKTVTLGESETIQHRFEDIYRQLGDPAEMMLVSTDENWPRSEKLIVGLPDVAILRLFDGFSAIPEATLPEEASLVVAKPSAFAEHFSFCFPS